MTNSLPSPAAPHPLESISSDSRKGDKPVSKYAELANLSLPKDVQGSMETVPRGMWEGWVKQPDEGWGTFTKRWFQEGSSVPDAFLNVAATQVGQIMLVCPNALWKAGLIPGCLFIAFTIIFSLFTMHIMSVLYLEYKRAKVAEGKWTKDRHVTQYFDVINFHAGKWVGNTAQVFVILQCLGTGIAQVIACAADYYSIDKTYSKRELQVIWGAVLTAFTFFPTFKHFRILNIVALAGTTMTAIYLLYESHVQGYENMDKARLWPEAFTTAAGITTSAPQYFFTGCAVLMNALGGHAIAMEMMDAMESPKKYTFAYTGGWLWTMLLVIPHSIAINLAFPSATIRANDNVFGFMPMSKFKQASVALMIVHQLAAYAYYLMPVVTMWERFIGTHARPLWIRLPSRIPVSVFCWMFAMAFPFYGAINSLMASVSVPFTAFALPALVYIIVFRLEETRNLAIMPPWKCFQAKSWLPIFLVCGFVVVFYAGFGFAAISYSIKSIYDGAQGYGIFARCYQCPANYHTLLRNDANGAL